MSEVQVIKNISQQQQNSPLKSISDHENESSKPKYIDSQKNIDSNQTESIQQIPNPNTTKDTNKRLSKNESEKIHTIRKCIRKGSRVCYTDMENITVLRKIPERDTSKSSTESNKDSEVFEKIDSYRSGESLFKTFTFEQTRDIDDPETVKCIEFWKSVMKKNLAPIKCTLIESDKNPKEKREEKSLRSTGDKRKESKESDGKKDRFDFTGDGARIWSEALKEIRKKKLDQLKLYVRDRCQYCTDPFTKDLNTNWGDEDLGEQEAEIVSLNLWKPKEEQIDLTFSLETPRRRSSLKQRKMTTSQTIETRIKEKPDDLDQEQREYSNSQSKAKIVIPDDGVVDNRGASFDKQESRKRRPSILKSKGSAISDSSRRQTDSHMTSAEIQAPNIKCPCDSDTCLCPHRTAARNSRTSFVEIARQNMVRQDASIETFFPTSAKPCICDSFNPQPWQKLSCSSNPCPAKLPKIKVMESSSDFDLTHIVENKDICVCTQKKLDVVCPSENCKNKMSQGSLVQGFPPVRDDNEDPCACTTQPEATCRSDVCPIKVPKEVSTSCVCGNSLPWSQATCKSWNCRYHQVIKRKRDNNEDKTTFRGHSPIKKITSTCMCREKLAWNDVECDCELCIGKSKPSSILKIKDRKSSILKTIRSDSKGIIFGKRKKSVEKPISKPSLEMLNIEMESVKPKIPTGHKLNGCICSVASPWRIVKCQSCVTKDSRERRKPNPAPSSADHISIAKDVDCVCKDAYIEPMCKVHDCKNKEIFVEYPPPCVCPKDLDESKHHNLRCFSESCPMKKIDKTCLCRSEPDAPCDVKTCVSKPQASKRLVQSKKPLKHDAKCICKVRGLPTTQEVTCFAPECPNQKKYPKVSKKQAPKLFVPPAVENKIFAEDVANECICSTKDGPKTITCRSQSCKRKDMNHSNDQSSMNYHDEEYSDEEQCICNGEQTDIDKEVICNHIQCPKKSVDEDGTVTVDKCVCANLDQTCNEPTCPSTNIGTHDKICSDLSHKMDRPYCYICGHYDCASASEKTANKKVCEKVYTELDDM